MAPPTTPLGRLLRDPASKERQQVTETDPFSAIIYALATGLDPENLAAIPELTAEGIAGLGDFAGELFAEPPPPPPAQSFNPTADIAALIDPSGAEAGPVRQSFQPPEDIANLLDPSPTQPAARQPMQQRPMQPPANPTNLKGLQPPWAGHQFWTAQPGMDPRTGAMGPGIGRFAREEQEAAQQRYGQPGVTQFPGGMSGMARSSPIAPSGRPVSPAPTEPIGAMNYRRQLESRERQRSRVLAQQPISLTPQPSGVRGRGFNRGEDILSLFDMP